MEARHSCVSGEAIPFRGQFCSALLLPPAAAFVASFVFSIFVYPHVAAEMSNNRVGDRYDLLAEGLLRYGTLAYYPDPEATTERTPLYPLLLAACMTIAGDNYTFPAILLQSLLHAATVLLVMLLLLRFARLRTAVGAALICALHPILLWYSGRFVIETLLTFLYTLGVFAAVRYRMHPSAVSASIAGACVGLGLWCKAVFAPLLIVFPAMILFGKNGAKKQHAALALVTGIAVISPWLVRNGVLTGQWPLLQSVVGLNIRVSDSMVDHVSEADPLSLLELNEGVDYEELNRRLKAGKPDIPLALREVGRDTGLLKSSLQRYAGDPLFLTAKAALNALWFWSLGSSRNVTLLMAFLQGSLLLLFIVIGLRSVSRHGFSSLLPIAASFAAAYYIPHVFVFSLGRFSAPLIPSLVCAIAAGFAILKGEAAERDKQNDSGVI